MRQGLEAMFVLECGPFVVRSDEFLIGQGLGGVCIEFGEIRENCETLQTLRKSIGHIPRTYIEVFLRSEQILFVIYRLHEFNII
jgi:hypothetical protein